MISSRTIFKLIVRCSESANFIMFNSKFFLFLLIGTSMVATISAITDSRCIFNAEAKACTTDEFLCDTCSRQVRCTDTGRIARDGSKIFNKVLVNRCARNQHCVTGDKGCVDSATNPDPYCDGVADMEFQCPDAGIFPDLFYCNKYHFCRANVFGVLRTEEVTCNPDMYYDIAKKECVQGTCNREYPMVTCVNPGDNGVIRVNGQTTQFYYVCISKNVSRNTKILYPLLYKCADGKSYDGIRCL